MKTPKLVLTSANAAAVTYAFVTEGEGFKSWALCTVNDQTGELLITSDWGSWSHRWLASSSALGLPTLTAFIGTRGGVDYLAKKLQGESTRAVRFSEEKTAEALRRLLCQRRLAHGRVQLESRLEPEYFVDGKPLRHLLDRYTDDGLPVYSGRTVPAPNYYERDRTEQLPYLTAEAARSLWDEIGETVGECSPSIDLLYDRLLRLSGFLEYVTEEPWNYVMTEQTPEDRALRDIVLPALIKACKSTVTHRENLARIPDVPDDAARTEALRAYVVGYVSSRPADSPLGHEAEASFDKWWNDPSVALARAERRGK